MEKSLLVIVRHKPGRTRLLMRALKSLMTFHTDILNPKKLGINALHAKTFFELIARPTSTQLDALSSLTYSESAGSNAEKIVLAKKQPLKDKLFPGENYIKELNSSYWKEGFKRINRKKFGAKYN